MIDLVYHNETKMEVFRPDKYKVNLYDSTIVQSGAGGIDRYIYSQDGEGIASFFGNLFRNVSPMIGEAIKGATRIAKPHLKRAAADIVTAGSERALDKISGDIKEKVSKQRSKRRKAIKIIKAKHHHNLNKK